MPLEHAKAYCVMGICGCGKSTIAKELSKAMRMEMLDADDFHPQSNVEKMAAGKALNDEDRAGWLKRMNEALRDRVNEGRSVVLACSALKQKYRDALAEGGVPIRWVYLKGDRETVLKRMEGRSDHFMPASLVDSQLDALEEPSDAVVVDIRLPIEEIVERALSRL